MVSLHVVVAILIVDPPRSLSCSEQSSKIRIRKGNERFR